MAVSPDEEEAASIRLSLSQLYSDNQPGGEEGGVARNGGAVGGGNCSSDEGCFGGVCCDRTGTCVCSEGFTGEQCELQVSHVIWSGKLPDCQLITEMTKRLPDD